MEPAPMQTSPAPTPQPNNPKAIISGNIWIKCPNSQRATSLKTGCNNSNKSRWVKLLITRSLNRYYQRVTMEVCDWKTQITPRPLSPWSFTIITRELIVWSFPFSSNSKEILNLTVLWCPLRANIRTHHWRCLRHYSSNSQRVYIRRCRGKRWSPRQARCSTLPARAYFWCSNRYCHRKRGARRGSVDRSLLVNCRPSVRQRSPNSNYIKLLRLLRMALESSGFNHKKKNASTVRR